MSAYNLARRVSARLSACAAFLSVSSALLSVSTPAQASPDYPQVIQDELKVSCPPPCTICHQDNNGGLTTVLLEDGGKPFGDNMMNIGGLEPDKPKALTKILRDALDPAAVADPDERATAEAVAAMDADGDGVPDLTALQNDTDPNIGGSVCGPAYGCGASIAKRGGEGAWYQELDPWGAASAGLVAAGLLWLRRRRALA